MTETARSDFSLADHGTIALLTPLTDQAESWCADHMPDDALRHGRSYAVEPRCAGPIVEDLVANDFSVTMG